MTEYERGIQDACQRIMEFCSNRQMDAAQSRDAHAVYSESYGECQGRLEAYGATMAFAAGVRDEADGA